MNVESVVFIFENGDSVMVPFKTIDRFTISDIRQSLYVCQKGTVYYGKLAHQIYFSFKMEAMNVPIVSHHTAYNGMSLYERLRKNKDMAQISLLDQYGVSIDHFAIPGDWNVPNSAQQVTDLIGAWELTI